METLQKANTNATKLVKTAWTIATTAKADGSKNVLVATSWTTKAEYEDVLDIIWNDTKMLAEPSNATNLDAWAWVYCILRP